MKILGGKKTGTSAAKKAENPTIKKSQSIMVSGKITG